MTAINISFSNQRLIFYIVFMTFLSSVLPSWTDGALPLPAHLLSRIVANVKSSFFAFVLYVPVTSRFVMFFLNTYVDLVISNL